MLSIDLMVKELGQLLVTGFGFGFLACAIVIIAIVWLAEVMDRK